MVRKEPFDQRKEEDATDLDSQIGQQRYDHSRVEAGDSGGAES